MIYMYIFYCCYDSMCCCVSVNVLCAVFIDSVPAVSSQKPVIPSLVTRTRPEEDILFQWRLRRKMEQARESPQSAHRLNGSTFTWQAPSLSHSTASALDYKVALIVCCIYYICFVKCFSDYHNIFYLFLSIAAAENSVSWIFTKKDWSA